MEGGIEFPIISYSRSLRNVNISSLPVIHSISHFANLWNFSRSYNEQIRGLNFANYKNEVSGTLNIPLHICMGGTLLPSILTLCNNTNVDEYRLSSTSKLSQSCLQVKIPDFQNPVSLLLTQPGLTGVSMLLITGVMAMTSLRAVRRRCFNAFWYTHHLYLPFMVLLLIHPLR